MHEARLLDFLTGKSHFCVALNATGSFVLFEWFDHASVLVARMKQTHHITA
jgi:hypothetical protein